MLHYNDLNVIFYKECTNENTIIKNVSPLQGNLIGNLNELPGYVHSPIIYGSNGRSNFSLSHILYTWDQPNQQGNMKRLLGGARLCPIEQKYWNLPVRSYRLEWDYDRLRGLFQENYCNGTINQYLDQELINKIGFSDDCDGVMIKICNQDKWQSKQCLDWAEHKDNIKTAKAALGEYCYIGDNIYQPECACFSPKFNEIIEALKTKCYEAGGNNNSCNFINEIYPYCNYEPCQNSPTKTIYRSFEPCNPITIHNCNVDIEVGKLVGDLSVKCKTEGENVIGNEDTNIDIGEPEPEPPIPPTPPPTPEYQITMLDIFVLLFILLTILIIVALIVFKITKII